MALLLPKGCTLRQQRAQLRLENVLQNKNDSAGVFAKMTAPECSQSREHHQHAVQKKKTCASCTSCLAPATHRWEQRLARGQLLHQPVHATGGAQLGQALPGAVAAAFVAAQRITVISRSVWAACAGTMGPTVLVWIYKPPNLQKLPLHTKPNSHWHCSPKKLR